MFWSFKLQFFYHYKNYSIFNTIYFHSASQLVPLHFLQVKSYTHSWVGNNMNDKETISYNFLLWNYLSCTANGPGMLSKSFQSLIACDKETKQSRLKSYFVDLLSRKPRRILRNIRNSLSQVWVFLLDKKVISIYFFCIN